MSPEKIAFQGEMQLLSWGETNTRGRTVTFQLHEDGDEHPFKAATTKSGKRSGQRYAAVLVQIGDDEQPVEKTPSQMAFLLCKDPVFQHYLDERFFITVKDEESARACICEGCQIKSRSQLDTDPAARNIWLQNFYNPFTAYRASLDKVL